MPAILTSLSFRNTRILYCKGSSREAEGGRRSCCRAGIRIG